MDPGFDFDDAATAAALKCRRFWLPRGIAPNLQDGGFLVDPEILRTSFPPPPVDLNALTDVRVLALLGEPGLGKSTVFEQEAARLNRVARGTDDQVLPVDLTAYATDLMVHRSIIETEQFRFFRKSDGSLFLLLDGLDTCIQHVETAVALLLNCLKQEDFSRIFLRIACRTVAWPPDLEHGLKRLWPAADAVQVLELAPLRRNDVHTYAEASGVSGEAFLKEVDRVSAHQFANRPISLRFLLKLFRARKELPSRKTDLYREGCLVLCDEERGDRRRLRRTAKLSAGLRYAAAARLAAVSIFCRRTALWTAPRSHPVPDGDVWIHDLLGGHEEFDRESVIIGEDAIGEAVDTGLFRSIGRYRFGFSHQTYAEYLAAAYLVDHKMPVLAILQLVLHPDGSGKVIPPLRETAAWLAALVPEICETLQANDPATLFGSDTLPSSDEDRKQLIRQILRLYDAGELFDLRMVLIAGKQEGARLKYPELEGDLRPFIGDSSHRLTARLAAIMIVRLTNQASLDEDVLRVALDPDEHINARIAAVSAVGTIGSRSSKKALIHLIHSESGDAHNRLKGPVLLAIWPECLTAEELFEALTFPKTTRVDTQLEQFLRSDFAQSVPRNKLPIALRWAREQLTKAGAEYKPLGTAAFSIVFKALDRFDDPETLNSLADVFVRIVQVPIPALRLMNQLACHSEARRAVARAATRIAPDVGTLLGMITSGLIDKSDLEAFMQDLICAPSGIAREKIADIVAGIVCDTRFTDSSMRDQVFAAAKKEPALAAALRWASGRRAEKESQISRSAPVEAPIPDSQPTLEDRISMVKVESATAFEELCQPFFVSDGNLSEEMLPEWQTLSTAAQAQIVRLAEAYLRRTSVDDGWIETQFVWSTVTYGYWALRILSRVSPGLLNGLSDEIWESWMPSVFGNHYQPDPPDDTQISILKHANQRCPARFREVLARFIDAQNRTREDVYILDRTHPIWDPEIADMLRGKLSDDRYSPRVFRSILASLLTNGDAGAFLIASNIVTAATNATGDLIEKPIQSALELIVQNPNEAWKVVWPVVKRSNEFAGRLFSCFAIDPHGSEATLFLDGLDDHQLAEWYIWLSRYAGSLGVTEESEWQGLAPAGFQEVGPTRGWHSLSTTVLNALIARGTAGSLAAIRFIDEKEPDENLKRVLLVAEEYARQKNWVPLTPSSLIEFVAKPLSGLTQDTVIPAATPIDIAPGEISKRRFVKTGKVWSVHYEDAEISIPHALGMLYISHLLRSPGRAFSCTELRGAANATSLPSPTETKNGMAELASDNLSVHDLLDSKALKKLKIELLSINGEIAEAQRNNDLARFERLTEDRDAMVLAIQKATGFGGRRRKFSNDAEKARKSVREAITNALKRMAAIAPELMGHLRERIRLGHECFYRGDGNEWKV